MAISIVKNQFHVNVVCANKTRDNPHPFRRKPAHENPTSHPRLLAALLMLLVCTASAALPTSGSCGPNLQWNLDKATGVLTISGTGPMEDYGYSAVWYW